MVIRPANGTLKWTIGLAVVLVSNTITYTATITWKYAQVTSDIRNLNTELLNHIDQNAVLWKEHEAVKEKLADHDGRIIRLETWLGVETKPKASHEPAPR
jgi:hypothetical protein